MGSREGEKDFGEGDWEGQGVSNGERLELRAAIWDYALLDKHVEEQEELEVKTKGYTVNDVGLRADARSANLIPSANSQLPPDDKERTRIRWKISRATLIEVMIVERPGSRKTMSAADRAASEAPSTAIPQSATLSAGASLTPSPWHIQGVSEEPVALSGRQRSERTVIATRWPRP
jgi:hypothetical protein